METQLAPQIFVIPQKMLQKQSLLKVASPAIAPAAAAPKYRVILSDSNKINRVQINNKIQIAKSKPVATVVGCKRPAAAVSPPCLSPKADIKIQDEDDDDSQAPMRKRANLDHLSAEERMQRRKLKNRVAAQNARDKKKAQTEEMEKLLDQMRAEKDALAAENARLQAFNNQLQIENASLIEENTEYKQKLGLITVNGSDIQQVQIELPMSPASLPPLSPISSPSPSSPVSVSPLSVSPDHSMVPPESAAGAGYPCGTEDDLTVSGARVVVSGLDSLGPELCGHSVLCSGHDHDDFETVLDISPDAVNAIPTISIPQSPVSVINNVAIEEEKLDMLEPTTAQVLTEFQEFLDCPTEETEFDKILASNENNLETSWNDNMDIWFPDLD